MKLLACLLNWRTAEMTIRALEALVRECRTVPGSRICVVDNDSQDGSFDTIKAAIAERGWADIAEIVDSGHNGGFGFGNNVAFRRGLAAPERFDMFYLLNSDAFPDEGSLATLVEYMEANPSVGIAGSKIRGLDGAVQHSAFRFPNVWNEIDRAARLGIISDALADKIVGFPMPAETTLVDWISGASMMIRSAVLEKVGLFDETYFLYYEETDLCLRAKRAGFDVAYVPAAVVAHIGGASTGVSSHTRVMKPMPTYMFESRRHYFLKNFGRRTLWAANLAYAFAGASFRVRRIVQGKQDPERPREWLDWVMFNLKNP